MSQKTLHGLTVAVTILVLGGMLLWGIFATSLALGL
jgi:hypothetical protein